LKVINAIIIISCMLVCKNPMSHLLRWPLEIPIRCCHSHRHTRQPPQMRVSSVQK